MTTKIITFEEFAKYLSTLEGEQDCPVCHNETWELVTPNELSNSDDSDKKIVPTIPGTYMVAASGENRKVFMRSASLNLLIMQCKNCGFMNFFNYRKVEQNITSQDYNKKDGLGDYEQTEE